MVNLSTSEHLLSFVATANMPLCICFAGIEPHGNMVKQPAIFTVDTISAGQGDLMVFVEDPEGNREEVCMLNVLLGKHKAGLNAEVFAVASILHKICNLKRSCTVPSIKNVSFELSLIIALLGEPESLHSLQISTTSQTSGSCSALA